MKKKINNICIITGEYPTVKNSSYEFVAQLVRAWKRMGLQCQVICPVSITKVLFRGVEIKPKQWIDKTEDLNIPIYSPRYVSFSAKKLGFINASKFTLDCFQRSVLSFYKNLRTQFDVVYGHFIFPSGIVASKITEMFGTPSFLAYGENSTYTIDYLGEVATQNLLKNISGVIAVSSENKRILKEKKIVAPDIIQIFPNAINNKLFYRRDKIKMRKKYNFPLDDFIIAFVGHFINVKGANRLSQAIELLPYNNIKSIFIGRGNLKPSCKGILLMGPQPHEIIPELLSAADIFVLPTLAEGCCNAIIEAMACGLPIVSSNQAFNDDILDNTCSIRINPLDIGQIANAIKILYENRVLRESLSKGALNKAKKFNIENRAKKIITFMEDKINYVH